MVPSRQQTVDFDCTPLFHRGYWLAFIRYAIVIASMLTLLFGRSVGGYWPLWGMGGKMLLICGTGWLMQMLLTLLFIKEKEVIDYLGHLAVLMIIATLVLLPSVGLSWLTNYQFPMIPLLSVAFSSTLMTWQHVHRIRLMGLSQGWTWGWFFTLQSTAACWAYAFWLADPSAKAQRLLIQRTSQCSTLADRGSVRRSGALTLNVSNIGTAFVYRAVVETAT